MPFERYLRAPDTSHTCYRSQSHAHDDPDRPHTRGAYSPENTHPDYPHPHAIQFQIPQFMLDGPPVLAPGGGAEVLPAGLLDGSSNPFASSWLANNGFAPFHSASISRLSTSGSTPDSTTTTLYNLFSSDDSQHRIPQSFSSNSPANVNQREEPLPGSPPSLDATSVYTPSLAPSPSSATPLNTTSHPSSDPTVLHPIPSFPLTAPSTLGISVYSASGFDVLSILGRVLHRPNPTVQLGPVDLSCSFVIVDVRRHDSPIVYASPTFCHLTGYSEQEVLGRNCRFLQSPAGTVAKGEPRCFTSSEAVSCMRKSLSSSKECQTTLINYKKGGRAFINLVTVIPLRGGVQNTPEEIDEVAYHIGFQVDLTEQPNRILDKLRDGSYQNSPWAPSGFPSNAVSRGLGQNMTHIGTRGRRHGQMMNIAVSKELSNLIADMSFANSVSISTGANMSGLANASTCSAEQVCNAKMPLTVLGVPPPSSTPVNRISAVDNSVGRLNSVAISPSLSLLLLEFLPDFLLVLSLKGAFLYVAPSVRLVLGYEPEELVGRSISDVCHPADLVPLMRELKEGSVSGLNITGTGDAGPPTASSFIPKSVDLLFRALSKGPMSLPPSQAHGTSAEGGNFQHSQSSDTSGARSSPSSGLSCSNDPSDGAAAPYVWLECRGRLHVEPGKGRKAIILSGRARWMPVVRWDSIDRAGGLGNDWRQEDIYSGSNMTAGPSASEMSSARTVSIDPLEFWALLSTQGTFLVASASVRDVLGFGTSEVIGKCLWTMVRDSRGSMRERVEAELTKVDPVEESVVDLPPTVVTTSLVHKELRLVPVRLVFYRTLRPGKHAPPSISSMDVALTPLIHPLNNPLCPVVCQATVLPDSEHRSRDQIDDRLGLGPSYGPTHQANVQTKTRDNSNESLARPLGVSLFEELETLRGSSWQYELQQLKFTNQRLHEELHALEVESGARASSSSTRTGLEPITGVPFCYPRSSPMTTTNVATPQQPQIAEMQLHYTPLAHSTLGTRPPNSLHEQDPPCSHWSSLAGANEQARNSLKRSWHSEDSLTT